MSYTLLRESQQCLLFINPITQVHPQTALPRNDQSTYSIMHSSTMIYPSNKYYPQKLYYLLPYFPCAVMAHSPKCQAGKTL